MDKSKDYEIDYARIDVSKIRQYIQFPETFVPLKFPQPVGAYTLDPEALYAGRKYTLGLTIDNIDLQGKFNDYKITLSRGRLINEPKFDPASNQLVITICTPESEIPKLDTTSLITNLWDEILINLTINDRAVRQVVALPVAFSINSGAPSGETFYNSDKAFCVLNSGEKMHITLISASGGGAGVNFVKGDTSSGGVEGGDATLCYLDPTTGKTVPIVFLEGGKGGRLSTHATQNFKARTAQTVVFKEGILLQSGSTLISAHTEVTTHNNPSNEIDDTSGGKGFETFNGIIAAGGKGGYREDLGYRGEGGMSGAKALIDINYLSLPNSQLGGPFIIVHPKTMVNVHKVIEDKTVKIKKTKIPMLAGDGGESVSQAGEMGNNGTMIIGVF